VTRISEIIHERRSVSADTALRLARYFGTDAEYWLRFQMAYDLSKAQLELRHLINKQVPAAKAS
jgi:addiction module HigA family antidote